MQCSYTKTNFPSNLNYNGKIVCELGPWTWMVMITIKVLIFSVVLCLRCLLHHILSLIAHMFRENRDFAFIIIVQFMMSSNSRMRFGLQIVFGCLYINIISLSSLCKLIWRHWAYKMPVRYILSSLWVILSIFSQSSIMQYMGLCVFSLRISLVMIEEYILCRIIIIKSEVWTIRVRSWNTVVRCMSLYILQVSA